MKPSVALDPLSDRLKGAIAAEERAGLAFAFRARTVAVLALAVWLALFVPAPRDSYYLGVLAVIFGLGLVPHLLRGHRHARAIRLLFILLDVALVTAVIVLPPPLAFDTGLPQQMRIRFAEYLYLNLIIVASALSYSPLLVLWTGICVMAIWSAGVLHLYSLPDSVRIPDDPAATVEDTLRMLLSPTYVDLPLLLNQLVLTAIGTGLLVAAVARSRSLLRRQTQAEVARADIARYVSPDVADAIVRRGAPFGESTTREVFILFADIVGFSRLSEEWPPTRVVALLRGFHARCCRVVFAHGGTLDKYLGDGFLATFGTMHDTPDAAARAARCALALQEEMRRWNRKRRDRGAEPVELGIGLHCGRVVVGNIGVDARLEFTVVGDAVNVASRLERLTREHGCSLAVSEDCLAKARELDGTLPPFRPIGQVPLPGRAQPVQVHVWPAEGAPAGAAMGG